MKTLLKETPSSATAVLDDQHIGHIQGAFGTIRMHDTGPRKSLSARLKTLLAILGPGLIVMVGDNDAGAFGTYAQAGQNYGYTLLWTLLLLIPVLYINQEMVVRLGAVTGVGHARLILERFGKFWGAFSVIDLFLLNALTIVTEFIGIDFGLHYLGLPVVPGVILSAILMMFAVSTGSFQRFERFAMCLVGGTLIMIPMYFMIAPPAGQVLFHTLVPGLPQQGKLSDIMLLIIGIVGTTVAPWQLFFQQSYVIDKRITPRFIRYERMDLMVGIAVAIFGGIAIMACTAHTFAQHPEFGNFKDVGAVAQGMENYFGRVTGTMFAFALIVSSIIGAAAVSLSTAYALGDVLSLRHSLHRKPSDAKGFYAVYFGLIVLAAALVLAPGVPLGLLTSAVQTLAGVLLPSASVFLLLLCNDKAVLGPWTNGRGVNIFTSLIVAILVMLSVILTLSVVFPDITEEQIKMILATGLVFALLGTTGYWKRRPHSWATITREALIPKEEWRMPPLETLAPLKLTPVNRFWMATLRAYLLVAAGLVLYRIILMAISGMR
ncbi:NRAMP family divalent metal transporter [Undibacterium oligocarboniphilum]|uniref:Divalent metal cation transporter n=1 Tax=Undibacterium oligocarboniphilum TaxID=666702 RepID=A0A850QHU3_9BURK|nr:NRAMP family divalent metal transporter [Undibacterium oligocarboniphilum]MBC3870582.1 divalent metal cation transporter [Undibacterium oligocarboniphilum]NVO78617.1 divalent metal cation transporter [Undibacterium oligocarboniphilum]